MFSFMFYLLRMDFFERCFIDCDLITETLIFKFDYALFTFDVSYYLGDDDFNPLFIIIVINLNYFESVH